MDDHVPFFIGTDFDYDTFDFYARIAADGYEFDGEDHTGNFDSVSFTIDSYMPTIDSNYDKNLTSAHKYLGDGLRETNGRIIFEEGVIHQIPILFLNSNLVPGQIFPLIGRSLALKGLLKFAIARNCVFGVSFKPTTKPSSFGTIAEIYEHSGDVATSNAIHIKAMGRQRYEILKTEPFPGSGDEAIALAQIRIIPDITLSRPFNKCRKKDMLQAQWPAWVYNQFDSHYLASKIATKVRAMFNKVKVSDDPYLLSLQVTRLGIFSQEKVSSLLGIASTNLRLQQELNFWTESNFKRKFMCSTDNCNTCICDKKNVIPMSPDGPQGTYCNAWGKIQNMITVNDLDLRLSVVIVGHPSAECCWFPGYRWTIFLCPNCHNHLGWRYTANRDSELKPRVFYGLCVNAITSDKTYIPNNINDDTMDFIDAETT